MKMTITIDVQETLKRFASWLAKVEPGFQNEVEKSMEAFLKEHNII